MEAEETATTTATERGSNDKREKDGHAGDAQARTDRTEYAGTVAPRNGNKGV